MKIKNIVIGSTLVLLGHQHIVGYFLKNETDKPLFVEAPQVMTKLRLKKGATESMNLAGYLRLNHYSTNKYRPHIGQATKLSINHRPVHAIDLYIKYYNGRVPTDENMLHQRIEFDDSNALAEHDVVAIFEPRPQQLALKVNDVPLSLKAKDGYVHVPSQPHEPSAPEQQEAELSPSSVYYSLEEQRSLASSSHQTMVTAPESTIPESIAHTAGENNDPKSPAPSSPRHGMRLPSMQSHHSLSTKKTTNENNALQHYDNRLRLAPIDTTKMRRRSRSRSPKASSSPKVAPHESTNSNGNGYHHKKLLGTTESSRTPVHHRTKLEPIAPARSARRSTSGPRKKRARKKIMQEKERDIAIQKALIEEFNQE